MNRIKNELLVSTLLRADENAWQLRQIPFDDTLVCECAASSAFSLPSHLAICYNMVQNIKETIEKLLVYEDHINCLTAKLLHLGMLLRWGWAVSVTIISLNTHPNKVINRILQRAIEQAPVVFETLLRYWRKSLQNDKVFVENGMV